MHLESAGQSITPVERAIAAARHILPDQGPIGVFIHHNTLHHFQALRFHDAVQKGAELIGARPYMDLHEFRAAYAKGRIDSSDVDYILNMRLGTAAGEELLPGFSRLKLWRALMIDANPIANAVELQWVLQAHQRELFSVTLARVDALPGLKHHGTTYRRHADVLRALNVGDPDVPVGDELVRLSAGFLDQGQALSPMPGRERGFLHAVAGLYAAGSGSPRGCPGVDKDFAEIARLQKPALQTIEETMAALGVEEAELEGFIVESAAALAGWAGMFQRLEMHPAENHAHMPVALNDFLAVRFVLARRAIEKICNEAALPVAWKALLALAPDPDAGHRNEDAMILLAIAEAAGLAPRDFAALSDDTILLLWQEVLACPPLKCRELWTEAYEHWYYRQTLNGIAALRPERLMHPGGRPRAQYMFCMDEREESIRRALEEQGPEYQTFGLAGFFGVAIDYQGLYDPTPAAYCPVVVTPAHEVHEKPVEEQRGWHITRKKLRDAWRAARRNVHYQSRTLAGGAGFSLLLGPIFAVSAMLRILFPRESLGLHDSVTENLSPRPVTKLIALRDGELRSDRGKFLGFTLQEATDRVTGVLRSIGLVDNYAPVVIVLGHGSTSLNNPHESAHDCGACGGRRGAANARVFAALVNLPEVRAALRARGIVIPDDTWFVGGLHDTADDSVPYSDIDEIPPQLLEAFKHADTVLDRARRMSAAERCRRFHITPLNISPDAGLAHVETRSRMLAQPRPEYGHCTNAVAVVGRRSLTRGLHLDRRAFLISYDPTIDPDHGILERILAAAGPVGAGISLEYFFSSVDNERYGCGTKLPHNVIGLLGIMNGHKSDLRTGLPLQMVELHEPMRLLVICESTPEALLQIAGRQAEVRELVVNRWIQLASVDPDTGAMHIFTDAGFIPYKPETASIGRFPDSAARHGMHRDHLTPVLVDAMLRAPQRSAA
ncbi:MAG: hypothetical protein RLZZ227_1874 [Pseudomonadota bacterium]|jgi:uncharacterized protein YbcC (UPF0753/DUF2309 family)